MRTGSKGGNDTISKTPGRIISRGCRSFLLFSLFVMWVLLDSPALALGDEGIALFASNLQTLTAWHSSDRQRVGEHWRANGGEKLKTVLVSEWEAINTELQKLLSTPDYKDSSRCYQVYSAERYGHIHVLGLAKIAREKLLMKIAEGEFSARRETPPADFYPSLLSLSYLDLDEQCRFELGPSAPDGFVQTEQVKETLNSLDLPDRVFDQYRINLLPFYINNATGLSFTSSLPLTEEQAIIGSNEPGKMLSSFPFSTITHEFGHFVHQQYLGNFEDNRAGWEEYLKLRGKSVFKQEGEWAELTEENFAEDFKVLFGGEKARAEGHRGSYGDPRQERDKGSSLSQYMLKMLENPSAVPLDLREYRLSAHGSGLSDNQLAPVTGLGFTETLVTTRPQVKVHGNLVNRPPAGIAPAYLLEVYDEDEDQEGEVDPQEIQLSERGEVWSFNECIVIDRPGVYSLDLGELDRSRPMFKIYNRVKLIYQPLSSQFTPYEKVAMCRPAGETNRFGAVEENLTAEFVDLNKHWSRPAVEKLQGREIVTGYADGTYRPDSSITRAEFIALLVRGKGITPSNGVRESGRADEQSFADVTEHHWARGDIDGAAAEGILRPQEYDDNRLDPDQPVSRQEMAAMAVRALGLSDEESSALSSQTKPFRDLDKARPEYRNYIAAARTRGIISGFSDETYKPLEPASRGEAAVILCILLGL